MRRTPRRFSRTIAAVLIQALLLVGVTPVFADDVPNTIAQLNRIETVLYGKVMPGALIERINHIEQDLFGKTETGALVLRIQKADAFISTGALQGASLKLKLNAAEWMIYQKLTEGQPLLQRIDAIETGVYGTPQKGSVVERIDALVKLVWPSGKIETGVEELAKETVVKISLLTELNSASSQVGQKVRYRVTQDLVVNNKVLLPAGAEGVGTVTKVDSAGRLGRDGRVEVDFGSAPGLDGTLVTLTMGSKAFEINKSLEGAAAASMAGILLLGPIGLIGGYFVKGQDIVVPVGTQFFLEVAKPVKLTGLSLVPQL